MCAVAVPAPRERFQRNLKRHVIKRIRRPNPHTEHRMTDTRQRHCSLYSRFRILVLAPLIRHQTGVLSNSALSLGTVSHRMASRTKFWMSDDLEALA